MEDGRLYGHLVYVFHGYLVQCVTIIYIIGIFGYLVFFPNFGRLYQEKSGNPAKTSSEKDFVSNYVFPRIR
jgi:hypothetical protein